MRADHRQILRNARMDVEYVHDFLKDLACEGDTRKLWRAWSGLLDHYVAATAALRRATDTGPSKAWSDDLLHQQRNDPILRYALQARNSKHVAEVRREVSERAVSVGGFISVAGNSDVKLSNNFVIGPNGIRRRLPEGSLRVVEGRYAGGTIRREQVDEHDHHVVICDVTNRGETFAVPNPGTPVARRAIEIGAHVAAWLKARLDEATAMAVAEPKKRR